MKRRMIGVALVLAAAACGGGGDGASGGGGSRPDTVGADAGTSLTDPTPLEAYLGGDSPAEHQALIASVDKSRQEFISQCMHDQGFDYRPIDFSAADAAGPGVDLSENEFLLEHGYGYTASFDTFLAPPIPIDDPNVEIVAGLSPAEADAYNDNLGACFSAAADRFPDPDAVPPEIAELLGDLKARIANDSRVLQATQDWSGCMLEQGYTYSDRNAIFADIDEQMAPVYAAAEDAGANASGPAPLSQEAQAVLEQVRGYELAVAKADVSCKGPLDDTVARVQRELEEVFIEEHGDELSLLLNQ